MSKTFEERFQRPEPKDAGEALALARRIRKSRQGMNGIRYFHCIAAIGAFVEKKGWMGPQEYVDRLQGNLFEIWCQYVDPLNLYEDRGYVESFWRRLNGGFGDGFSNED